MGGGKKVRAGNGTLAYGVGLSEKQVGVSLRRGPRGRGEKHVVGSMIKECFPWGEGGAFTAEYHRREGHSWRRGKLVRNSKGLLGGGSSNSKTESLHHEGKMT